MDNFVCFSFRCLVILLISLNVSSDSQNCFGEYCFTYPGVDVTRSFEDAISWCATNDSSALALVSNKSSQDALVLFLSSTNIPSPFYINAKLDRNNGNTWYLITGEQYPGSVENQTESRNIAYQFYSSFNIWRNAFAVLATSPQGLRNYICKYRDGSGLDVLPYTYCIQNGSVYIKYENESLNWFEARNRCHLKGGDLATFVSLSDFDTTWLNLSHSYWIGFRWGNHRWKTMDDESEIIYTSWSSGRPNNSSFKCVCIDGSSSGNWIDCDCSIQRPFVCAKYRNISVTPSISTTPNSAKSIQNVNQNSENSMEKSKLAIGVGVGVGGGVLLILIVVVVIIVIKTRKSKQDTTDPTKTKSKGKTQKEPKEPKKPKETKVTQLTSDVDGYAEILVVSQPGLREPTTEPVVYATPEFLETN